MVISKMDDMIKEKGLKKKFIAEKLKINEGYFSRITKGKVIPNIETLHKIAQYLECYIDDLYKFND